MTVSELIEQIQALNSPEAEVEIELERCSPHDSITTYLVINTNPPERICLDRS